MEMWRIRLWTPEHPSREMVTCRELGGDGRERERERESECVCVYVCVCVCVCVSQGLKTGRPLWIVVFWGRVI